MTTATERHPSIPEGTPARPVMPDAAMVSVVLARTRDIQFRYDHTQKPEKLAAKARAAAILHKHVRSGRLLDIGGEDFYHRYFSGFEITTHNLPDLDMHEIGYEAEFDVVVAMHVLEHSPFPMLVLALINRALRTGGYLYVAVPRPSAKFCLKYGHWSVMSATMWATVIKGAGFSVLSYERGKFGPKRAWIEERFLCQRAAP